MKYIRAVSVLLLLLFLSIAVADAQPAFSRRSRYNSVGLSFNAVNYFGDIVPTPDFTSFRAKSTRPGVALTYYRRFYPRIAGRASLSWGRITGDDRKSASLNEGENEARFKRNLSFRNDIKEINTVLIVDLFENRFSYQRRPDFVPYGFVGVAFFHHNPKAYYETGSHPGLSPENDIPTGWYELRSLGTEGQFAEGHPYPSAYERFQFSIPVGLGVRYKLDNQWDLSFEIGWRKTFTDYLDDVSSAWADKNHLLAGGGANPKASAILSDRSAESGFSYEPDPNGTPYSRLPAHYGTFANKRRGNKSDDDWYIVAGLEITYIIRPNRGRR